MSPDDPRHGSVAGYSAHRKAGEPTCRPCKDAVARYQADREKRRYLGDPHRSDAQPIVRRLRALYALGWTAEHIAKAGGWSRAESVHRLAQVKYVTSPTREKVYRAYAALSGKRGPSDATRARAVAAGYAPPLAWDDIDRDTAPQGLIKVRRGCGTRFGYHQHLRDKTPTCAACRSAHTAYALEQSSRPVDRVVVERLLKGETVRSRKAERDEAMRRWLAAGGSERALCEVHGWRHGRYGTREEGEAA